MSDIIDRLGAIGVVPVVAIDDAADAVKLARALVAGGLPVAEVTFRTATAEEAIRRMTAEVPDILVGAGTVLAPDQVDRALDAGARFIVSPGLNPAVVRHSQDRGVPITPGTCTPTEIEQALGLGLTALKFFPAEPMGGLATLKAVSGPYGMVRFMPTGGISTKNLRDYLAFDKIICCGGSWMVGKALIREGRFDEVERLAREAADIVADCRS